MALLAGILTVVGILGLAAAGAGNAAGLGLLAATACEPTTVTQPILADTWLDENSPFSAKGSDAILSVEVGDVSVDTGIVSGRARVLVRFGLPAAGVPAGCVLESARLRIFSTGETIGTRLTVQELTAPWSEEQANWANQPAAVSPSATAWSREGYIQWNVTPIVQGMLDVGMSHGFQVRDAAEGAEEGGGGHGFNAREKGEDPPQLVIRFAAPPSGEPPGPPEPPAPTAVACGDVLTVSTLVTNDLFDCQGDGLVIGADRIIVDLGGHTIDGVGLGSGVLNDGFATVSVRNGTIREFDHGVRLYPETTGNLIDGLTLLQNEVAAIELFDVTLTEIRNAVLDGNGGGILFVSGTRDSAAVANTITGNGGAGLLLRDAARNHLEGNSVTGGGDLGIGLERASDNALLDNVVSSNSDGGIEIRFGSHRNRVAGNHVTASGDTGIMVSESNGSVLISNTSWFMSDSGITLDAANDGIARGNDVRFNSGGLQLDGSSRNLIEGNDASETTGIGIELGGGSFGNVLLGNRANRNGSQGIYVSDELLLEPGNRLEANTASGNGSDGIGVAKGGHTIVANIARDNGGWGINAAPDNLDGLGNVATGNRTAQQCTGVVCRAEWIPPETEIDSAPASVTNSTSATFAFSADDDTSPLAGLRFECRLDAATFAACTTPQAFAGLREGSHTFEVRATDAAGNTDPTPASRTWTVDTTAPETTIDSGPADPSNATTASFMFSSSATGSTFACSLDGAAFGACTSPAEYAGLAQGSHTFAVRATDPAGNVDPTPATDAWTVESAPADDTTPPETTLNSGPSGTVTTRGASFTFSSNESGSTFECALDGVAFSECSSPTPYSNLTDGGHTFQVRAIDPFDNVDPTPAARTWTVDATAPETTIDTGPTGPTSGTTASFTFSASEPAAFACSLDGGAFTACTSPRSYTGLSGGAHTFRVQATDAAGNTDPTPASRTWMVDTTAPQTTIDSGPSGTVTSTSATFTFSSSEAGSSFQCQLDRSAFAACTSPRSYTALAIGSHTVRVRAIDPAGNVDATPARRSWTIEADLAAP